MSAAERIPLSEVCQQDRVSVRAGELPHWRYIGMESIEAGTGQLAVGELSKTPEAPEANSFRFNATHVLYGKLRPYLNKVLAPDFEGKCSTELVPLLPTERLDRRYLAYFLRSPATVQVISQKVAGARMPRADMSFVLSLPIPVPSLERQRRLVDMISRSENIVRMRRQAEQMAKEIIPALFLDMFGDPATNPRGWGIQALAELGSIIVPTRDKPKSFSGHVPWITIPDLRFPYTGTAVHLLSHSEAKEVSNRLMPAGTVLLSCAATLGKVAVTTVPAYANQQLYGLVVRSELMAPEFLAVSLLMRGDAFYRALAGTSTLGFFSKAKALSIRIPVPPLTLQRDFSARVSHLAALNIVQQSAVERAHQLFQSLLAGVFGGNSP